MKNKSKIWNWRTFGAILCFYTIFSLFFLPRLYFVEDVRVELRMIFFFAFANYIWAGLTILIFHLGEKFPVAFPLNFRNLGWHLFFSLAIVSVFTFFYTSFVNFINLGIAWLSEPKYSAFFVINTATQGFMYYTGSLAAHQAVFYSRKFHERESQLQEAELQILKMQLHPHFFFNTLNAISALMYRSPKVADRMIVRLGDMFRMALKKDKTHEVSLKEELEFLESFLQVHQTLMGKRLQIEWRVQPETLDAAVPNLILQPLAENAVDHGIAPLEDGGCITICAEKQNGKLHLQINDDGMGFGSGIERPNNGGIGLSNTRARLENLYGGEQNFSISEMATGGVIVQIEIPFRRLKTN